MSETTTRDTTVIKIDSRFSPSGELGQEYLASGVSVAMRLWDEEPGQEKEKPASRRDYETVGFVLAGRAELHIEGQMVLLEPGNSWVVPKGAEHRYRLLERFKAVEATSPPAHAHSRDKG